MREGDRSNHFTLRLSCVACALTLASSAVQSQSLTEWPTLGGNAGHWGYSPASQINQSNINSMGLLWYSDLPVKDGPVGNPLVEGGVVYQSVSRGVVLANDVATGKLLWSFVPALDLSKTDLVGFFGLNSNRGLALDEHHVYVTSGDCHLYAIDRITGKQVWMVQPCDATQGYGIIAAPRTGGGAVFVGNNNHEEGMVRGYEDAFDGATGKHLWRFYTVPGDPAKPAENKAMEMAAKTWDPASWKYTHRGANPWDGSIYDPQTGLFIFGSGNPDLGHYEPGWMKPKPDDAQLQFQEDKDPAVRAALASGDWLFSSSIIAVDAKTGEYAWHFQYVPHDRFESDAAAGFIIADLSIDGAKRHVVMQAAKDGYFYVLDVKTGKCISANNYVAVEQFYPIDHKSCELTPKEEAKWWLHPDQEVVLQPGAWGAHGWTRTAYNPVVGLVYIPAFIAPQAIGGKAGTRSGEGRYGYNPGDKYQARGLLIAWDPVAQKERWHVDYPILENGGVLTTAGNLVLQGNPDGRFLAYAADSGKLLWSYETHSVILGQPTTVMSNGKQIILVPAGDGGASLVAKMDPIRATTDKTMAPARLLAFGLGGARTLPPTLPKSVQRPARPPQPTELAARGARLFAGNSCGACHGTDAAGGAGNVPDLRNSPEALLELMPSILEKGVLRDSGMPQFPNFSDDDVNALQAYIINQAWAAYNTQQSGRIGSPPGRQ